MPFTAEYSPWLPMDLGKGTSNNPWSSISRRLYGTPLPWGPHMSPLLLPDSHAGLWLLLCFPIGNSTSSVPLTDMVLPWASGMGSSFSSITCHLNVASSEKSSLTTLSNTLLPPSSLLMRHFAYSENLA